MLNPLQLSPCAAAGAASAGCSLQKACDKAGAGATGNPSGPGAAQVSTNADICKVFNHVATVCRLDTGMGKMGGRWFHRQLLSCNSQALPGQQIGSTGSAEGRMLTVNSSASRDSTLQLGRRAIIMMHLLPILRGTGGQLSAMLTAAKQPLAPAMAARTCGSETGTWLCARLLISGLTVGCLRVQGVKISTACAWPVHL